MLRELHKGGDLELDDLIRPDYLFIDDVGAEYLTT
jgi:hypothetical protein